MTDRLFVYLDTGKPGGTGDTAPALVGEVFFTLKAGTLVSSTFRYNSSYLARSDAFPIDPALPMYDTGTQSVTGLPGALQDSSPDRWGRNLVTKERRAIARDQPSDRSRLLPTLTEADFLVGVSDSTRQGALRFRADEDGPFLAEGTAVPKLIELSRLLRAADAVSRDDDFASIKELLDAGSGSLGGARPKASVRDGDQLHIAKFPHPDDTWNVMAWEKTALDLAERAGIRVPRTRLTQADGRSVLLLERFDRRGDDRVPYISAMTLLSAHDGDSHDYVEIAEALPEVSAATTADLHELWRRIAFSLLVNNTDDHLRNHGFLRVRGGWRLSPVFDVNPNPDVGTPRQTTVGGAGSRDEALAALCEYSGDFDLTPAAADEVIADVTAAVVRWRDVAAANNATAAELDLFAAAFWIPKKVRR